MVRYGQGIGIPKAVELRERALRDRGVELKRDVHDSRAWVDPGAFECQISRTLTSAESSELIALIENWGQQGFRVGFGDGTKSLHGIPEVVVDVAGTTLRVTEVEFGWDKVTPLWELLELLAKFAEGHAVKIVVVALSG